MATESRPRFSIVIPTRNRVATLQSTLQTCLAQSQTFSDFELVVADNCSQPPVLPLIEAFADARIRLIRQERPLAMSENWEVAVAAARGEYVIVLGDDDALLPNALAILDRLIEQSDARVINWPWVHYAWPDSLGPDAGCDLYVPMAERFSRRVDAIPVLIKMAEFETVGYAHLPMLYNSVVHVDVLEAVRQRAGRVFVGRAPDIVSGILIAYVHGEWLSIGTPLSVAGLSPTSNGYQQFHGKEEHPTTSDFNRLNQSAGHDIPAMIPGIQGVHQCVAEELIRCKAALFPADERIAVDRRRFLGRCMESIKADSAECHAAQLAVIRGSCADSPELLAWFDEKAEAILFDSSKPVNGQEWWSACHPLGVTSLGATYQVLRLKASEFGVDDIHAAAILAGQVLGLQEAVITFAPVPASEPCGSVGSHVLDVALRRILGRAKRGLRRLLR